MIQDDRGLSQTRAAVAHLEDSLAALNREVLPLNPGRFALMAEPIAEQLVSLRAEIDQYLGVAEAHDPRTTVWLRLVGPQLQLGEAPTSIVTALIDYFRVGVQTVAEFTARGSVGARPTHEMKQACDFQIASWQPGSVRVALRLPDRDTAEVAGPDPRAVEALQVYMAAACWIASDDDDRSLAGAIPDEGLRRVALQQVGRIVPRPRGGLEAVELSAIGKQAMPSRLERISSNRIRSAVAPDETAHVDRVDGVLREIDLDNGSFIVRRPDSGEQFPCSNGDDVVLLAIAKDALDHVVRVSGVRTVKPGRKASSQLTVTEIEVFESEGVSETS